MRSVTIYKCGKDYSYWYTNLTYILRLFKCLKSILNVLTSIKLIIKIRFIHFIMFQLKF